MAVIPPGVKAVFFDAVGTLLFPDPLASLIYADAARRHGLHVAHADVRTRFVAAFRREEEADIAARWATSEARERARWRAIVADTLPGITDPDACFRHLFDHFAQPGAWRVAPDAAGVLAALHTRGFVLGMGSNYDARLLSVLAGFPELAPLADRVVVSAAVGVRKPGAGFFREVCRVAGCEADEVLFVGDDAGNDYEGATAAGLHALLLDPQAKHADVPHRITRLAELLG